MPDEKSGELQLHTQLRTAQDKYTYFLLAVVAAAVAYAIKLTTDSTLSFSMVPLGLAILGWGLSFFFGCKQLRYVSSTIYANYELLRVQRGEHPQAGSNPQFIAAASEGIRQAIESNSDKISSFAKSQFRFLIAGSILFLDWHIIEMALKTNGN